MRRVASPFNRTRAPRDGHPQPTTTIKRATRQIAFQDTCREHPDRPAFQIGRHYAGHVSYRPVVAQHRGSVRSICLADRPFNRYILMCRPVSRTECTLTRNSPLLRGMCVADQAREGGAARRQRQHDPVSTMMVSVLPSISEIGHRAREENCILASVRNIVDNKRFWVGVELEYGGSVFGVILSARAIPHTQRSLETEQESCDRKDRDWRNLRILSRLAFPIPFQSVSADESTIGRHRRSR